VAKLILFITNNPNLLLNISSFKNIFILEYQAFMTLMEEIGKVFGV